MPFQSAWRMNDQAWSPSPSLLTMIMNATVTAQHVERDHSLS
jgi:hypothetical protein